jgi:chemotaxis family two-component system response regulator Rcp1
MHDKFHILLVEDSESDSKIIERALRDARFDHRLTVIRDGRQALEFLASLTRPGLGPPATAERREPDLILLDLNLPGLDGYQVLAKIKSEPVLRVLPVVVLTTSGREEDIRQTYRAGANTYIQKPAEYARYREVASILRSYWQETALRPRLGEEP